MFFKGEIDMAWYNPFSWGEYEPAPADASGTLASAGQRYQEQADVLQHKRGAERG